MAGLGVVVPMFRLRGGSVPDLLTTYVFKHPRNDLEALNEIIRSLPITLGLPDWKPGI
jgi:hypothetical protein